MKLIIGNDHAGIELKKEIVAHLHEQGYIVQDVGVDTGERLRLPHRTPKRSRRRFR